MGRAAGSLLIAMSALLALAALAGCGGGDRDGPAIPGPTRATADAGPALDAGGPDAWSVRPLDPRPPGSGGIPAAMDPRGPACPDPVVGVWVAKTYAPGPARWHEHRLSIRRGTDDELVIDQTTRIWNGDEASSLPALCPQGGPSWGIYRITDRGRFVDGILHVWGVEVRSSEHSCGGEILDYNLDSFTGRVHRDTYTSRNNDGSEAVNRPYHFRRVACAPD